MFHQVFCEKLCFSQMLCFYKMLLCFLSSVLFFGNIAGKLKRRVGFLQRLREIHTYAHFRGLHRQILLISFFQEMNLWYWHRRNLLQLCRIRFFTLNFPVFDLKKIPIRLSLILTPFAPFPLINQLHARFASVLPAANNLYFLIIVTQRLRMSATTLLAVSSSHLSFMLQ